MDPRGLKTGGLLASFVHSWGALRVRLGIAIVLGSMIFAGPGRRPTLRGFRRHAQGSRCSGPYSDFTSGCRRFIRGAILARHSPTPCDCVGFRGSRGVRAGGLGADPLARVDRNFQSTGDAWVYGITAGLAAWGLGIVAQKLWLPLSRATLAVVAIMIRPFIAAVIDPASMSIGGPSFAVEHCFLFLEAWWLSGSRTPRGSPAWS